MEVGLILVLNYCFICLTCSPSGITVELSHFERIN